MIEDVPDDLHVAFGNADRAHVGALKPGLRLEVAGGMPSHCSKRPDCSKGPGPAGRSLLGLLPVQAGQHDDTHICCVPEVRIVGNERIAPGALCGGEVNGVG